MAMDITLTQIFSVLTSLVLVWFGLHLTRKYRSKQIENLVASTYQMLTKSLNDEITRLNQRIHQNDIVIEELKKHKDEYTEVIEKLQMDNEILKYRNTVTELEMIYLKKHNDFNILNREVIGLLDDDHFIHDEFHQKFDRLSMLELKSFNKNKEFMAFVRLLKPRILIIDHKLEGGKTADDIIEEIGYEPKILIISGSSTYKQNFAGKKNIQFYVKNDHYVHDISIDILQYLIDKN